MAFHKEKRSKALQEWTTLQCNENKASLHKQIFIDININKFIEIKQLFYLNIKLTILTTNLIFTSLKLQI